jgi:nicotinamide-nucleotide amidase
MDAEIIAVGSEMLTPERLDTNSLFLTAQLNDLGIEVTAKHVIGDDRERLAATVRRAFGTVRLVIISGGLGPTEDDVTRDAVALALDRRQILNADILSGIEQRFRSMNRQMPEINRRQAMVIEGAHVLGNERGTAPGQWIEEGDRIAILLPGPPHELKHMFERQCVARLARVAPPLAIRTLALRISGMSESELDQTIAPIYKRYENPTTTVLAHNGDMQVHLRARCATEREAEALLREVGSQIEVALGDRIYSRNGDPLEVVIGQKLSERRATIAVAESATGGGLADRISLVPGSSAYFLGGFITYSRRLKTELLGVPEELLHKCGPVSREVAEAMANGVRRRTGATYAIATTGNAGPTTDGPEAPAGTFYVAIASPLDVEVTQRVWPAADRVRVRAFAAQMALDLLNRKLSRA